MKRLLALALVLAGCGFLPFPQNTTGAPMEVYTHCGLGFITIDYEGKAWKFDVDDNTASPPMGWKNGNETVYLEEVDGELIAHGPDGADYRLVERTGERPWDCL